MPVVIFPEIVLLFFAVIELNEVLQALETQPMGIYFIDDISSLNIIHFVGCLTLANCKFLSPAGSFLFESRNNKNMEYEIKSEFRQYSYFTLDQSVISFCGVAQ